MKILYNVHCLERGDYNSPIGLPKEDDTYFLCSFDTENQALEFIESKINKGDCSEYLITKTYIINENII